MAIIVETPTGRRIAVGADSALIGRDGNCQIALPDEPALRPIHAKIRKVANRWMVEAQGDWQLQVGTGLPGRMSWLTPGDVIRLTESGPELIFEEAPAFVPGSSGPAPIPNAPKAQAAPTPKAVAPPPVAAAKQQPPPLPSMAEEWFYASAGEKFGPFSSDQLRQFAEAGVLLPEDMVWKTGMANWVPASSITAFFPAGPALQRTPAPPLPPARPVAPATAASMPQGQQPVHRRIVASNPPKDPILMAVLSGLLPPLGQFLLGQKVKALGLFLAAPVLLPGIAMASLGLGFFLLPLYNLLIALDAYLIAKKLQGGQAVGEWEFFRVGRQPGADLLPALPQGPPKNAQTAPHPVAVLPVALAEPPLATKLPPGLLPPLVGMQLVVGSALLMSLYGLLGIIKDELDTRTGVLVALTLLQSSLAVFCLAQTMTRGRRYSFTVLGTLLAPTCWAWLFFSNAPVAIPLLGTLSGFLTGTWALAVLKDRDVRSSFRDSWVPAEARWERFSAPAIAGAVGGGALAAVLCVGFILWFATRERPHPGGARPPELPNARDVNEPRSLEEREVPAPRELKSRELRGRTRETQDERAFPVERDVRQPRAVPEPREVRQREVPAPREVKRREVKSLVGDNSGKGDDHGSTRMEQLYKALVFRIKPGMSKGEVEAALGSPDQKEQKDLGKFNPQKAGQSLEIWTWKDKADPKRFIMLSFVNGNLEDGGTPGYDIRKGFKSNKS
jgi:hypothetical protein